MKTSKRQSQRFYGLPDGTKIRRTHNNKTIYKLDQANQELTETTEGELVETLETEETYRVPIVRDLLKKHTQSLAYNGELAIGGTSIADFVPPETEPEDIIAPDSPTAIVAGNGNSVTGTAEADSTVTVKNANDDVLGTSIADENGNYSVNITPSQLNGEVLSVTATDAAGNVSTATPTIAPDLTAPNAPTGLAVAPNGTAVIGQAEAGSSVVVKDPIGSTIGTGIAAGNGSFSIFITPSQQNGELLSVTAADAAGNVSSPGNVSAPDITTPAAPTIDAVNPMGGSSYQAVGSAESNSTIRIFDNNSLASSNTASPEGTFAITFDIFDEGTHNITAYALDAAQNISTQSNTIVVSVDTTAPAKPTAQGSDANMFKNVDFVFSGEAEPESEIKLLQNGTQFQNSFTAGLDGTWSRTLLAGSPVYPLTNNDTPYNFTVTATDAAGNVSVQSDPVSVFVTQNRDPQSGEQYEYDVDMWVENTETNTLVIKWLGTEVYNSTLDGATRKKIGSRVYFKGTQDNGYDPTYDGTLFSVYRSIL